MHPELHDITAQAGPREHSPEFRAGLEALGWVVLGRVRLGTEPEIRELAEDYPPDMRDSIVETELVGMTVLRSADSTAFALIDWFFECPFTRMMTLLDDGSLVETQEAWTCDPVQTRQARHLATFLHRRREQLRFRADGRSIELVDAPTPESLTRAHEEHVARTRQAGGAAPLTHGGLPRATDLWRQQFAHGIQCMSRATRAAIVLSVAVGLILQVALFLSTGPLRSPDGNLPGGPVTSIGFVVVPVLLALWLLRRLVVPMSYLRWLAPDFRGTTWHS